MLISVTLNAISLTQDIFTDMRIMIHIYIYIYIYYIGCAIDINNRQQEHTANKTHTSGRALPKNGISNLTFEILETVQFSERQELYDIEDAYMIKFDSINKGFNTRIHYEFLNLNYYHCFDVLYRHMSADKDKVTRGVYYDADNGFGSINHTCKQSHRILHTITLNDLN